MDSLRSKFSLISILWLTGQLVGCATSSIISVPKTAESGAIGEQWQRIQSDSTHTTQIKYFGFFDVTKDEDAESQYFEAGFARFDGVVPLSLLLGNFKQPAVDTCDYRPGEPGDSTPLEFKDELEFPGYTYEFVSAGDKVEVFQSGRRYAKLERTSSNDADAVQYEDDVGSLPVSIGGLKLGDLLLKTRGLRVSAAGDTFPAFSGIEVPPVDDLVKFKPKASKRITANTKFKWRTGRYASDPDVRVQIEAGGGGNAIFCVAADNGSFSIPEATKILMKDVRIPNPSGYRDAVWFYLLEDALLIVSQSSYY